MYNPDQDLPDCMMPDGGEACGSYARLYAAFKEQALKLNNAERGWAAASQSVLALESRLDKTEAGERAADAEVQRLQARLGALVKAATDYLAHSDNGLYRDRAELRPGASPQADALRAALSESVVEKGGL